MTAPFDPVARLVEYHAAITRLDFAAIEAMLAPEAVYVSGGVGGRIEGRAAIIAAFRSYFAAYGDQVSTDMLVERLGDLAARSEWSLAATHARTKEILSRRGEEIVLFSPAGLITTVDVKDFADDGSGAD